MTFRYPNAGDLQRKTVVQLAANPRRNSAPPNGLSSGDLYRWNVETDEGIHQYWAEDEEHAREQHWDAAPDVTILDVWQAGDPAYQDVHLGQQNPAPRGNASGTWEVVSNSGGLEGIFAEEDDAALYADELRRTGVKDAKHQRRKPRVHPAVAGAASRANPPPPMTRDEAFTEFRRLLRDPDPAAMLIAEDLALEHRWTLVALSELGHDHGIYVLSPMYPADAPLYRIEWNIAPMYAHQPSPREFATGQRRSQPVFGVGFSFVWNNNDEVLQFGSTNRYMKTREAAQRAAAADGWALAKRMKHLMVTEPQLSIDGVRVNLLAALREPDATAPELYEHRSTRDSGAPVKKQRTFPEARDDLLEALRRAGWLLSTSGLKLPWAQSPNGKLKLWFKPQAVHYTQLGSSRDRHNQSDARSAGYDLDIRKMSSAEFISHLRQHFPRGFS